MEEGGEGLLQAPAPPPPSPGTGSAEREGWGAAEDLGLLSFPGSRPTLEEIKDALTVSSSRAAGACGGEQPGGPRRGTPVSRPGHRGSPPPRTPALPALLPPPPPPPPPPRPPLPRFLLLPSCPGAVAAAPASPPFPGSSSLPPAGEAKPKKNPKNPHPPKKHPSGENTRHLSHPSNPGAAPTAECTRRRRTSAAGRYLPAPGAAGRFVIKQNMVQTGKHL
ncbi:basic proline-rich protein-like [Accipiter gentilis]|uniref:basic proline-rich protein-like n=1 Tax=Astur gentilis TaxID=8957 RepID=UPI00211050AA|nr:basic proline-rich protein-like [Accipiter gentilis]